MKIGKTEIMERRIFNYITDIDDIDRVIIIDTHKYDRLLRTTVKAVKKDGCIEEHIKDKDYCATVCVKECINYSLNKAIEQHNNILDNVGVYVDAVRSYYKDGGQQYAR